MAKVVYHKQRKREGRPLLWSRWNAALRRFARDLKAARHGDLLAMSELGAGYATDRELGIRNPSRSLYWYSQGAALGDGHCQHQLGFMFLAGEGTPQDTAKGLEWLGKSVANGVFISARHLGEVYAEGHFGVKRNKGLANFWKKKWLELKDKSSL